MKKYRLSFFMLFFTLIFVQAVCAAPEYLLPDADSHYYTKDEIADMPVQLVCYAKNEIYARHGRQFVSPELQKYFGSCSWYHGTVSPDDFNETYLNKVFNDYEKKNMYLMADRETELLPGGYVLDQPGYSFEPVTRYLEQKYGSGAEQDIESIERGRGDNTSEAPPVNEVSPADPAVLSAYQPILDAPGEYFPEYQTDEYATVDYQYSFTDMNSDGFPEMLLLAMGGKNYTMYDGRTVIEYWPADIRIFSWSPLANRMYTPEGTVKIGAAPVGGFRGDLWSSVNHDCLWYSAWSSGTGAGGFYMITIKEPYDEIGKATLMEYQYTMVNNQMVPFEYEDKTEGITWMSQK